MDNQGDQRLGGEAKNPMTKGDASRIQSAEAKQHGGGVPKGSFASRAQSTADKRENQSKDSGMDNQGDQRLGGEAKNPMTKEDASRIQSSEAKQTLTVRKFVSEAARKPASTLGYSIGTCPAKSC